MKVFVIIAALSMTSFVTTGCLQTRTALKEQEEKQVLQKTVKSLQKDTADVNTRFSDIDEDLRKLDGRIEAVEFKLNQAQSKADTGSKATDTRVTEITEKMKVYQEELTKLDTEMIELRSALAQMQEEMRKSASSGGGGNSKTSEPSAYQSAEGLFKENQWKDAILEYEKYRKASPKGKQFADATYKIGVCFQELSLTEEAKAFYEEVTAKFPKSKEAEKASYRLKTLNKKK
ncbi:MAG: tetratricopeptide repeat protein [Bdellovibrionaceae bacterium]|nr:tetratricopeptide repeat protein [Pseudobdellovibrionaceae bacterium]